MTSEGNVRLEALGRLYDAYVDTYRLDDGTLPRMMRLKREHTGFVVKNVSLWPSIITINACNNPPIMMEWK